MEEGEKDEKKTKNYTPIKWKSLEYEHTEKNSEWFWSLGLLGIAGAFASIMLNNVLFAIFILIAVFVLALYASRTPDEVHFTISQRGLQIDDKFYPYKTMKSFGIEEMEGHTPKLIMESKKLFTFDIIVPLKDVDIDEVQDFLLDFLIEEDHEEPLVHKIMEWLGF